jgi:predicted sulfurtransferase
VQGFDRLTVQAVKEVVSLGAADWMPGSADGALLPAGAPHLEPAQFHALLEQAAAEAQRSDRQAAEHGGAAVKQAAAKETVLIDTRNFYESRIGRFEPVRERCGAAARDSAPVMPVSARVFSGNARVPRQRSLPSRLTV